MANHKQPGRKPQGETPWQRMTREDRIAWTQGLAGETIRYALRADVEKGRRAFGPNFPIPWREAHLYGLATDLFGRPCLSVRGPVKIFGTDVMHEPWDNVWDVQVVGPALATAAPASAGSAEDETLRQRAERLQAENLRLRRQVEQLEAELERERKP